MMSREPTERTTAAAALPSAAVLHHGTGVRCAVRTRATSDFDSGGGGSSNSGDSGGGGSWNLPVFPPDVSEALRELSIGATVAFGGLVFAISFATLVFTGPDAPDGALAAGTSFVLFTGMVGAFGVALRSSLPAIAEVQDGPSAIFALISAAVYATEGIEEDAKLPTVEAAILLTTTATGAMMVALGRARLGNIVRLLPSPVTGGFLAGTGWVLTAGSFKVLTGLAAEPSSLMAAARSPELLTVVLPGAALGLALAVGNRRIGKFWVVPSFLLGGTMLYFLGLQLGLGMSPEDALQSGLLLGPFDASVAAAGFSPLLLDPMTLGKVRWDVVLDQWPRAATVFGLSTLGLLLITSAVEISTGREGDANEELKAVGAANFVSGLGGGLMAYHSLSSTQISHSMGTRSRLPGLVCAAAYGAALLVGPAPLAYVPSSLIGGLLLFIGLSFLYEWIVEGYGNLPRSEYAVVILIVLTVASQGYLAGVVAGILGAAAVFVADYSRVPIVRSRLQVGGLGGIRSSVIRSRSEVEVIARLGQGVYGAKLQGFLFFATAYKLLEEIRSSHEQGKAKGRPLEYVLLDFQGVVGCDGSAISVFEKLRRFGAREGITLVLSDVDRPELRRVVTITLYGEGRPTFAFVDRVDDEAVISPSLEGLNVSGGILASDESGGVVQARDLNASLRFIEDSMIWTAWMDLMDGWGGREEEPSSEGGVLTGPRGAYGQEDEAELSTFDDVVATVCSSPEEEAVFRRAWTPAEYKEGEVLCVRGEAADRIFWVEDAVLRVDFRSFEGLPEANDVIDASREATIRSEAVIDAVMETITAGRDETEHLGLLRSVSEGDVSPPGTKDSSNGGTSSTPTTTTTKERPGQEEEDEAWVPLSVQFTRDFMGAVGFYCQGGFGKVRFGRIVVEKSGGGFVLTESDVAALEEEHPAVAMKLHRVMAGTLANQVISRNKLITQYTVR